MSAAKAGILLLTAALCCVCYALGRLHARVEIVTQQVEVIRYVEKQKAEIYSRPNASRAALLSLMRHNKL